MLEQTRTEEQNQSVWSEVWVGLTGPPTGEKLRGRKVRFGGVSAAAVV